MDIIDFTGNKKKCMGIVDIPGNKGEYYWYHRK